MSKTAFMFPGQGSQFVGMGADLYSAMPAARAVFDAANDELGFSLTDIMFGLGGDVDEETARLRQTDVTQPALFVHSMAVMSVLSGNGITPDMAAGHSLGEYSALTASGALSFSEGLRLVRLRGSLMAEAGDRRPGSMAAIIGLEDDQVEQICADIDREGLCVRAANYNSPGQIVISGETQGVEMACGRLSEAGARRAVMLPVSGAFHSPLMAYAEAGLKECLVDVEIVKPGFPVVLNVSAIPVSSPDEIRRSLVEQLTSPVRWAQSLVKMQSLGASTFVEAGAGRVLSGLARRTLGRDIVTIAAGTRAHLDEASIKLN
jgi:[acyl-carrier-protein] S-malonyltransferase